MATDHIRYDLLAQDALRGVVRTVLIEDAKNGLPGEHHFYITFDTTADGVKLSPRMRAQYPQEMTIVLQHQFWDLIVTDEGFEVGLSFGGVSERLTVPFAAIKRFVDPVGPVRAAVRGRRRRSSGRGARHAGRNVPGAADRTGRSRAAEPDGCRTGQSGPAARSGQADRQRRGRAARPLPQEVARDRTPSADVRPSPCNDTLRARARAGPTRTETDTFGPIEVPPTAIGARRPSARGTISASATSACRSR